ncbi:hypothetical protein FY528_04190 [Hymenobacter lutimineralis]|uniref:Uncharacterized protein n=1 Tax=Hymenobacter lutimineralis TaxID=2606448 RepID=A0A5D6V9E6_9BACT|nr:hypothetical protein [Hymenobacter lutimineralis]TYZ12503.1 hypothetical protein FY528_04190 [Hymenobacter lutimineralis]
MENKQNQPSSSNSNSNKNAQSSTPSSFAQQASASDSSTSGATQREGAQKDVSSKAQTSSTRSTNAVNTESSASMNAGDLLSSVEERFTQGKSGVQSWISQTDWRETMNQLPQSVKDLGTKATEQFNKLTTTQKVVGGALLLGGLGYLASRSSQKTSDNEWSTAKARRNDYRSGNIPRVESSQRSSEWNKRTMPSSASTASSSSFDRDQDARRSDRGSLGHVNIDS